MGLTCPFVQYCSAADTLLKLLDRVVSAARVLTGGVFAYDIAHRRFVELSCMLYKIRRNAMHPLYRPLHLPYVPVCVTRGALVAHRYTYVPPRRRISQYIMTFIPLSVSLERSCRPCLMVQVWRVSRAGPMFFYWPKLLAPLLSSVFPFSSVFIYLIMLQGFWSLGLIGCKCNARLSQRALHCRPLSIIIIIK